MIPCEKTHTQSLLAGLEVSSAVVPNPQQNNAPQGEMEDSEAARKKRKSEYNRIYREAHKEEIRAKNKTWAEANAEYLTEYHRNWKKANPDKIKAKNQRYQEKNRDRILAKERERWHTKHGPPNRVFFRSEEEKERLKKERQHQYYLKNKEKLKADSKQYRQEHVDESRALCRERYANLTLEQRKKENQEARARRLEKDPDCDKRRNREKYKNDVEYKAKILAANKAWREANPEKSREIARETMQKRKQKDPVFRIRCQLSVRLNEALRGELKRAITMELVGCDREALKAHLESKFKPGMSWDNFGYGKGKWVVDHKVPMAAHDLSTIEGQKSAMNYLNLQPLWFEENIRKSSHHNGKHWTRRDHERATAGCAE